MKENTPWKLLAKYFAGECSPEEEREVEEWIEADPSRKELVEQLYCIWETAGETTTDEPESRLDMESEWLDLQEKMEERESSPSDSVPQRRSSSTSYVNKRRSRRRSLGVIAGGAAALLLALIGGIWLAHHFLSTGSSERSVYREVITEKGERSQVHLSDGTKIMLNVDSRVRLPNAFDEQKRVVHLAGEAFFDVKTDSTRPFVVQTEDAAIDVHGTAFNVRDYPEQEQVQVAVTEGGVSLRKREASESRQGVELKSGEVGRFEETGAQVISEDVDLSSYIGWTEGRLVFQDTPLPKVVSRLERWYNLEFELQDPSLESLHLTANLKSQSIHNVLDVVTASLGIHYRISQNKVFLIDRDTS